jgi:hypothetical protein
MLMPDLFLVIVNFTNPQPKGIGFINKSFLLVSVKMSLNHFEKIGMSIFATLNDIDTCEILD